MGRHGAGGKAAAHQGHAHTHAHTHTHSHGSADASLRALLIATGITAVIFVAEIIGGIVANSLALISDAAHMLTDATGLILALIAMLIGRRAPTKRATYGHRRIEVLAAVINGGVILAISVWIVIEAVSRIVDGGHSVDIPIMLSVGAIGLVANLASLWALSGQRHDGLNMRGAFLHVLTDLLGSIAVIVSGVIIAVTGWRFVDALASLVIAGLVAPRAVALLRESLAILLERVPKGVDLAAIEADLAAVVGVKAIHDLHVWTTSGQEILASVHVVGETPAGHSPLLGTLAEQLSRHGIEHSTIQIEDSDRSGKERICASDVG